MQLITEPWPLPRGTADRKIRRFSDTQGSSLIRSSLLTLRVFFTLLNHKINTKQNGKKMSSKIIWLHFVPISSGCLPSKMATILQIMLYLECKGQKRLARTWQTRSMMTIFTILRLFYFRDFPEYPGLFRPAQSIPTVHESF
jgi:hypothetical protein